MYTPEIEVYDKCGLDNPRLWVSVYCKNHSAIDRYFNDKELVAKSFFRGAVKMK